MERVLVLNQSYEPIRIVNWQRAIKDWVIGKVEIIKEYKDKELRSAFLVIKMPAVVRLINSFRKPRKAIKYNKMNLFARDRWKCSFCGEKKATSELTKDHVIPKSKGGKTTWENIVTCCKECNTKKGDRTPKEAGMRLRKKPSAPNWVPVFMWKISTNIPEPWKDYCWMV